MVRRNLPGAVWALGFASLFMDISSELVHSVLPVFLVTTLGIGIATVGLIEGIAEATAAIVKVFSGALSDYIGRRKPLIVLGYGLAMLAKPLFPLASGATLVITARFIDRVGKGIRGAPRDALITDVTAPDQRGAAFGLRQTLDSVGAFVGPLLALGLMVWMATDIRGVLWFAALPALVSVGCIVVFVREPERVATATTRRIPLSRSELARLSAGFWWVTLFASVLTLARFSDAFLILRAQSVGVSLPWIPAVMVLMNVVYAAGAYPAGLAADRLSRPRLLLAGVAALVTADVVLALADSIVLVGVGGVLWGLHMALTQGLLSAMVADQAPIHLRGTAFGVFNLALGLAMLLASAIAGALWQWSGPASTFAAGAGFTLVAGAGLVAAAWRKSI